MSGAHRCTHEPSHTCNSSPRPGEGGAEGGEHRRGKWKGGRNYYHSLPSQLIKSITSNMFLMMVKAGGNWFIWRCFKVNFSQVQRGSLKLCPCVCAYVNSCVCVCRMEFMSLGLTLMFQHGKKVLPVSAAKRSHDHHGVCVPVWACVWYYC